MPKSSELVRTYADVSGSRRQSLVDAFLLQMAEAGVAGASARNVAARADSSPSAINYHFESIERLYGAAQERALVEARAWLDLRLEQLGDAASHEPAAFSAFAAALIEDWCAGRHVLAHAEACDFVGLPWRPTPTAAAWTRLWTDFWTTAIKRFSISEEFGGVAAAVLQCERFGHLARWRPLYDRAGLEEVCVRLAARLSGDADLLRRPAPWRAAAEALSQCETALPPLMGGSERIAAAVVAAVDEGGEAALTHRSAALKAGLSLGAVTHRFPTRTALMAAGYAHLNQGIVSKTTRIPAPAAIDTDLGRHISSLLDAGRSAPKARAMETFFFAATRDPALAGFAARVRYSRGLGVLRFLGSAAPGLSRLDGLLISHWISGGARSAMATNDDQSLERSFAIHASALFSRMV